jgi:hypothetical protein
LAKLDRHWNGIGEALSSPERKSVQRQDFVRAWFQAGVAVSGPAWAHDPFVGRKAARYTSSAP